MGTRWDTPKTITHRWDDDETETMPDQLAGIVVTEKTIATIEIASLNGTGVVIVKITTSDGVNRRLLNLSSCGTRRARTQMLLRFFSAVATGIESRIPK